MFGPPSRAAGPRRPWLQLRSATAPNTTSPSSITTRWKCMPSTAIWDGDGKVTVYDKTQGVQNVHRYLCGALVIEPDDVRVMSPYMGGGFGSGLRPQYQVLLAALAARALKRSVRLAR